MRGGIPGAMNFDTQAEGLDLPGYDFYWVSHIPDPPMLLSEAMHLGSLAEPIEPNTCRELYGIKPFSRSHAAQRQRKVYGLYT